MRKIYLLLIAFGLLVVVLTYVIFNRDTYQDAISQTEKESFFEDDVVDISSSTTSPEKSEEYETIDVPEVSEKESLIEDKKMESQATSTVDNDVSRETPVTTISTSTVVNLSQHPVIKKISPKISELGSTFFITGRNLTPDTRLWVKDEDGAVGYLTYQELSILNEEQASFELPKTICTNSSPDKPDWCGAVKLIQPGVYQIHVSPEEVEVSSLTFTIEGKDCSDLSEYECLFSPYCSGRYGPSSCYGGYCTADFGYLGCYTNVHKILSSDDEDNLLINTEPPVLPFVDVKEWPPEMVINKQEYVDCIKTSKRVDGNLVHIRSDKRENIIYCIAETHDKLEGGGVDINYSYYAYKDMLNQILLSFSLHFSSCNTGSESDEYLICHSDEERAVLTDHIHALIYPILSEQ